MGVINDYGMPFTDSAGDRKYSSSAWRDYFSSLVQNGVIDSEANKLQVKPQAAPNKSIFVDTGTVFIEGAVRILSAAQTIAIADNSSGNPRIDRIVARLDSDDRLVEFAVLQGTPAASPSAPAVTRNTTVYELALADITLANGFTTVTTGVITDKRSDESVCGYAKTMYMQTFDDENNLLKYNRDVTVVDAYNNPTEVQYKRPADSSLFLKRVMSNPNASLRYQTIVEQFYLANGSTVYKTITYTLTYLTSGYIDTMTRAVV